ncbi:MAG: hypothetical protein HN905_03205 [Candidatus Marinimicrobia bacterium]|jgi:hypothetical protein|nr:hypothetical protein [Candidatus Neomarinimicrobiota bacterium]
MELVKKTIEYRNAIVEFEEQIKNTEGALVGEELDKYNPLKHTFANGYYIREINTPAGQILITKIHKEEHPFFLMKGECSILTEDGPKRIKAPYYDITKPGTKRIIYIHSDVTWVTVHATDLKDIDKIEEKIIAKDFNDPKISIDNLKEIKKKFNIK